MSLTGVAAVVLAGGKSRRMGRDKRFLELAGRPLIDRVLEVLTPLFDEILLSAAEPDPELARFQARVVYDRRPDCATLGGLYSALCEVRAPRVFAVACDMPFLNPALIGQMARWAPEADVVMARLATGLQPTHAVYSKACVPVLERMARAGNLRLQDLVSAPEVQVVVLEEAAVRTHDPQLLSFLNVNTPADLELARKLVSTREEPPS